ncbi:MAG: hypothetical protein ACE5NC_12195, partial [Anaerolineae bacterium]
MSVNEGALRALPEEVRETLRPYLAEVKKLFGTSLEAVILYGSAVGEDFLPGTSNINLLIVFARQEVDLLQRYSKVHKRWHKEDIVVPLFLTADELRSSAALFPLEFLEIKDRFVEEVLVKLRGLARREAELLFAEHRRSPRVPLPELSTR